MIRPGWLSLSDHAAATAAQIIEPGISDCIAAYATGTSAPGGSSSSCTVISLVRGGTIEDILTTLVLPMPAFSSAPSKAFKGEGPSLAPVTKQCRVGVVTITISRLRRSWAGPRAAASY